MNCALFVFLVLGAKLALADDVKCPDKRIVCYYTSWSSYREEEANFDIGNIDPFLCTHLVYSFAGLDVNSKLAPFDYNYDIGRGAYQWFTSLKTNNTCLKVQLAIGGWNEGSIKYSVMAATPESRKAFADSTLRYLVAYNFDGLDLDWEYPGQRGGLKEDKENFAELVKEIKDKFAPWGLQLSLAVPIDEGVLDSAYDVAKIKDHVDHVSIMAYDFTASDSPVTGLLAPLSAIKSSIKYWTDRGLPAAKLNLGVASYARTYYLEDGDQHGIGAPTKGAGISGPYVHAEGFLSYFELRELLDSGRYTVEKVGDEVNYFAYNKRDWFSFDKADTYEEKARYALGEGLGGMMIWTLDTDDFEGMNEEPYPILRILNDVFIP